MPMPSITYLKQSSNVSCPHLMEKFLSVLKAANADNVGFGAALLAASEKKELPVIANMMYSLAQSPGNQSDLLLQLEAQKSFASTREKSRCEKLGRNYARRWLPHLCFFIFFALPLVLCPMLGPAFQTTALAGGFSSVQAQLSR